LKALVQGFLFFIIAMTIESLYSLYLQATTVSTDTRNILPGSLFFALKGPHFDAHHFVEEALAKGALAVVIDNPDFEVQGTFLVPHVLNALQALATHHRQQLGIPILALTGSNGKTTTKELMAAVLSKRFKTVATQGNLNNHIGVPLTLLSMGPDTEMGIVEMGANHQLEIAALCQIAQPDYGYITNFGKAHLEGFGGFEGVVKGKSEMYLHLGMYGAKAFVNIDDALQSQQAKAVDIITFGFEHLSQYPLQAWRMEPNIQVQVADQWIHTQLTGAYNVPNVAAAITVGRFFGLDLTQIDAALQAYVPNNNRSQWTQRGPHRILLDAYNANPSSMKAALDSFESLEAPHKRAILGDMFELGNEAFAEHQALVDRLKNSTLWVYWIGPQFAQHAYPSATQFFYESREAFARAEVWREWPASTVLIKGSRGMALEQLLHLLDS